MARFVFWTLFVVSLTNAIALFITYIRNVGDERFTLGAYPVAFAVCAVLILAFTKGRQQSTVLWAAWAFWLVFVLGGFIGSQQITATGFRDILGITVKSWISLIGLPWLALRAISEDKIPRFFRGTVVVTAIGAVVGLLQLVIPDFLQQISDNSQRATGFWVNPNGCGLMCSIVFFISLMYPFQHRTLNWITRLLLIAGVAVSFSRAAILTFAVGWVVYGIATKRFGALLKTLVGLILFVAGLLITIETIEAVSPNQAGRFEMVREFVSGNWSDDRADNRTELWKQTLLAIEAERGLIFGLGHGSMFQVVDGGERGIAPHNYYLYVWGNSGILALLALIGFEFVLFLEAWKCTRREVRAALLAIAMIIALDHVFDHAFIGHPFTGVVFACIVLATAYGKSETRGAKRLSPIQHCRIPLPITGKSLPAQSS
jgi:O-antigen ligase